MHHLLAYRWDMTETSGRTDDWFLDKIRSSPTLVNVLRVLAVLALIALGIYALNHV